MQELLGEQLYREIESLSKEEDRTEIRVRLHRRTEVRTVYGSFLCGAESDRTFLDGVILRATGFSRYAHENELTNGYLEYKNGIRIGICGYGKINEKRNIGFGEIYSVCIRIPHFVRCSATLGKFDEPFVSTLVVAPPFCGKTTLIRDMAYRLSEKYQTLYLDERCELCGRGLSMPCGKYADVIQGIEKQHLYSNVIRAMAPQIIVCDELNPESDAYAIRRITSAGIKCLASYHAPSLSSVPKEIAVCFHNFITLTDIPSVGTVLSYKREE